MTYEMAKGDRQNNPYPEERRAISACMRENRNYGKIADNSRYKIFYKYQVYVSLS